MRVATRSKRSWVRLSGRPRSGVSVPLGTVFKASIHVSPRAIGTSVLLYASELLCIIAMQVWQSQILSRGHPGPLVGIARHYSYGIELQSR